MPRAVRRADAALDQSLLLGLVGYNCRRVYLRVMSLYAERIQALALSPAEFSALCTLGHNEGVTQKRLAAALDTAAPNLAVLLDRLVQRGLVARLPNPDDGRSQRLALTAAGRALLADAERIVVRLERDASAMLGAGERRTLIALLQRMFLPEEERTVRLAGARPGRTPAAAAGPTLRTRTAARVR